MYFFIKEMRNELIFYVEYFYNKFIIVAIYDRTQLEDSDMALFSVNLIDKDIIHRSYTPMSLWTKDEYEAYLATGEYPTQLHIAPQGW